MCKVGQPLSWSRSTFSTKKNKPRSFFRASRKNMERALRIAQLITEHAGRELWPKTLLTMTTLSKEFGVFKKDCYWKSRLRTGSYWRDESDENVQQGSRLCRSFKRTIKRQKKAQIRKLAVAKFHRLNWRPTMNCFDCNRVLRRLARKGWQANRKLLPIPYVWCRNQNGQHHRSFVPDWADSGVFPWRPICLTCREQRQRFPLTPKQMLRKVHYPHTKTKKRELLRHGRGYLHERHTF